MPLTETEKNKRDAASALLAEMTHDATPLERKIEITESMLRANPGAFFQVAIIHLKATADPKYQD